MLAFNSAVWVSPGIENLHNAGYMWEKLLP